MKDYHLSGNRKFSRKKRENNCVICVGTFSHNLSFGGKLKRAAPAVAQIKDSLSLVILCNWSPISVPLDVNNAKHFYLFSENIKSQAFCKHLMLNLNCFTLSATRC